MAMIFCVTDSCKYKKLIKDANGIIKNGSLKKLFYPDL